MALIASRITIIIKVIKNVKSKKNDIINVKKKNFKRKSKLIILKLEKK